MELQKSEIKRAVKLSKKKDHFSGKFNGFRMPPYWVDNFYPSQRIW
jgi:hypothetical protein